MNAQFLKSFTLARAASLGAILCSLALATLGTLFLLSIFNAVQVVPAAQESKVANNAGSAVAIPITRPATSTVHITKTIAPSNPTTGGVVSICFTISGLNPRKLDVALVHDVSGSMEGEKLTDAKTAAITFVTQLQSADRGAVIPFSQVACCAQPLTISKNSITMAISNLEAEDWTNMAAGISVAHGELISSPRYLTETVKAVVLLSDGQANCTLGGDCHEYNKKVEARRDTISETIKAADNGIKMFTIGFGEAADHDLLKEIADIGNGQYYSAPDGSTLKTVYLSIALELHNLVITDILTPGVQGPGGTTTVTLPISDSSLIPPLNPTCFTATVNLDPLYTGTINASNSQFCYLDSDGQPYCELFGNPPIIVGGRKITGHIFYDQNANGSLDEGEGGVSGITISTTAADLTAMTGASGIFVLRTLETPALSVTVKVSPDQGHIPTTPISRHIPSITGTHPVSFGIYMGTCVRGKVFEDKNENEQDDKEPGLVGAMVSASGGTLTTTGKDGVFFVCAPVGTGPITITEDAPNSFMSTVAIPGDPGVQPIDSNTLRIENPELGRTYGGNKFGNVRLLPDLRLTPSRQSVSVTATSAQLPPVTFSWQLVNHSAFTAAVSITMASSEGWGWRVVEPSLPITMSPDASVDVQVSTTLPTSVSQDITDTLRLSLTSVYHTDVYSTDVVMTDVATTRLLWSTKLTFSKSAQPAGVMLGKRLTFTLGCTNTGQVLARDIVITDTLPPYVKPIPPSPACSFTDPETLICPVPDLASGQSYTVTVMVTVSDFIPDTQWLTNTAELVAQNASTATDQTCTRIWDTKLALNKKVYTASMMSEKLLTYTLTYSNVGGVTAEKVILTDTLPPCVTLARASGDFVSASNTLTWELGDLEAHSDELPITIVVTLDNVLPNTRRLTNTARIAAENAEPDIEYTVTRIEWIYLPIVMRNYVPAFVRSEKTVDKSTALAGDILRYKIILTNIGTMDSIAVTVTDKIPSSLHPTGTITGGEWIDNTVWWHGSLSPLETRTIDFQAYVDNYASDTTITNMAIITASNGQVESRQTETDVPPYIINGDFEIGWTGWTSGGNPLPSIVPNPHSGSLSALLGDPDLACSDDNLVGNSWVEQTIFVPPTASPTLHFSYYYQTFDKIRSTSPNDYDRFNVIVSGTTLFTVVNRTECWRCDSRTDIIPESGKVELAQECPLIRTIEGPEPKIELGDYRGKHVLVRFQIRNIDRWYNTWAYVDKVQIIP